MSVVATSWVDSKEPTINHCIGETSLLMGYIYIYVYTPILATYFKFLNSNPASWVVVVVVLELWVLWVLQVLAPRALVELRVAPLPAEAQEAQVLDLRPPKMSKS